MSKLQGKELRKFDQVSRMSLPPKYRRILGEEIVVLKPIHGEPCIMLFSEASWDEFYENILECFEGAEQAEAERRIANRCDVVIPDKANRITIRDDFKAYANLTDEVLAVGVGDRVEFWNPNKWEELYGDKPAEEEKADEDFFSAVPYARARSKK